MREILRKGMHGGSWLVTGTDVKVDLSGVDNGVDNGVDIGVMIGECVIDTFGAAHDSKKKGVKLSALLL